MACANISVNFGAAFFWTITIVVAAVVAFGSWQASRIYHDHLREKERQRSMNAIVSYNYIPVDQRKQRDRVTVDPAKTLLRLKPAPERPPVDPSNFEGWRNMEQYWKVAAE